MYEYMYCNECLYVCMYVCMYVCIARFQVDSQIGTGKFTPPFEGLWHKCQLLNYPWLDPRPAEHLGAHTSLVGEYLFEPLAIRKTSASAVAQTPDLRVHRLFG